MHFELTLWDVVFRFTLFGLLAYKITSLIKQYAIPLLYEELEQERRDLTALAEKETLLFSTQRALEDQINQQKQQLICLEANVQQWHKDLSARNEQEIVRQNTIVQKLEDKRKQQQLFFASSKNGEKVIPVALKDAQVELQMVFVDDAGRNIFDQMLSQVIGKSGAMHS